MALVLPTGRIMARLYMRKRRIPLSGKLVKALRVNKDGSLTICYIRERDYWQFHFESQMDSRRRRRDTEHRSEYHGPAIPQQLVNKAVHKMLMYVLCFVVLFICFIYTSTKSDKSTLDKPTPSSPGHESSHISYVADLDFLEIAMANVSEHITIILDNCYEALYRSYNIITSGYSFTTSLCRDILFLVCSFFYWMVQSACHFMLWIITASLTFVIDNVLLIIGFIIFLLIGLGYLILIERIKKLSKTNAAILEVQTTQKSDLKRVEEKLTLETEKNCANLNEIKKFELKLKKKDECYLTLKNHNLNLESQKNKLKLQLQEKDKLNSKLELQNKDLQFKAQKKMKQNVVLKSEKVKLKSEKEEKSLKLNEATKLNEILEGTGSQLELELEKEKDKKLCIVCVDKYKNMLLLPCKHFSLCRTCWCYKIWSKCPICRQGIESAIDVYD